MRYEYFGVDSAKVPKSLEAIERSENGSAVESAQLADNDVLLDSEAIHKTRREIYSRHNKV